MRTKQLILWVAIPLLALAIARVRVGASSAAESNPVVTWNPETRQATMSNGGLELVVETKSGLNARLLRDAKSGQVYAGQNYSWPGGGFPRMQGDPLITRHPDGTCSLVMTGKLDSLVVEQAFAAPANEPGVIMETITIINPTDHTLATADFKCGFAKRIRDGETWAPDAADFRFCPVPYRRETDGKMREWPLRDVAEHGMAYAGWAEPAQTTPIWGAEGWVWSKGESSLLVAKYNPNGMEWSLMEPLVRDPGTAVRFGGAGQWKHGHPEGAAQLEPGQSFRFGETRFQVVEGNWKQAYYAYRRYLEAKGCRTPEGYNPPIHWNELYDNQYFFKSCELCNDYLKPDRSGLERSFYPENKKLLQKYYTLDMMLAEAAKARDLGCEALYMDPGWDIGSNQQIWDESRLGPMGSFVKKMKEDYGLKVSLWCALGDVPPSYGDPESCPPEARVIDKDGKPTELLCFASPSYLATKEKRMLELCRQGVAFLMFDSTQFSGPCYDKSHGHPIPSTRETHANALLELIHRVKLHYPNVLIELHDPISGPSGIHYTPTYYGYAQPHSFDCLWGHEFMWSPLDDLLSRRAVSLYYYNLAYSIPLYLHVNLKPDNENSLVFWWFASTCRHLGVGGKPGPAVWDAEKRAMQTYKGLKRFYTQGVFYGLEETVHAHTLPDLNESVINAFNLDDKPVQKHVEFRLSEIGLPARAARIEGAPFTQTDDEVSLDLAIPARGQILLRCKVNP